MFDRECTRGVRCAMRLGSYLKVKEITRADFGAEIGVSHVSVVRYVKGQRMPRPDVLERIHKVTHGEVTYADFYNGEDGPA